MDCLFRKYGSDLFLSLEETGEPHIIFAIQMVLRSDHYEVEGMLAASYWYSGGLMYEDRVPRNWVLG
jgi:hypothetical protein